MKIREYDKFLLGKLGLYTIQFANCCGQDCMGHVEKSKHGVITPVVRHRHRHGTPVNNITATDTYITTNHATR